MSNNPLKQYFRQPKIFIGLPSKGVYNKENTLDGDISNMPVYGMTGMDEILMKTPDALISGESTVRIIESCCPFIKDAWELSSLDTDLVLTSIRIATYGNDMEVSHTCKNCGEENEYSIDLTRLVDHFNNFKYKSKVKVLDLIVNLQPLTYRQTTEFSIRNFSLQQQLAQSSVITNEDEQKEFIAELFKNLGILQNDIFSNSIESVDTGSEVVTDRKFIDEWIRNCDKTVFDEIKKQFNETRQSMRAPSTKVECTNCGAVDEIYIDLDQASFFVKA